MCSSSSALQKVFDVGLLQAPFLGEELEAVSVEGQVRRSDDYSTIILISCNTQLGLEANSFLAGRCKLGLLMGTRNAMMIAR